jgi:prepilin-type N-terminal cleavage/methylation domain-containing protein
MKNNKGFSLIELVVIITIIGIILSVTSAILVSSIQGMVYLPNSLNMDMLAQDALDKIVDGDNLAGGLRFCKNITAFSANSITFTDQNSKTVVITLDTGTNKLTRTINAVSDPTFLYYQGSSGIKVTTGRNGALFLYYDASESTPLIASNIRRIAVNLVAFTGSGTFANWQGSAEYTTSIRTPRFL